jgi:hypothetical protein
MNKRIQEFLADKKCTHNDMCFGEPTCDEWYELDDVDIKEFIGLIARECIDAIGYHMNAYGDSLYEEGINEGMAESIRLIENKFGIE